MYTLKCIICSTCMSLFRINGHYILNAKYNHNLFTMMFDNFNMTLYGPMFTRCSICVIPAFSLLKFIDTFGAWSIEQQLEISAAGEGLKVSKGNIWLLSFDISDDYFLCQQKICSFIQTQRHISSECRKKFSTIKECLMTGGPGQTSNYFGSHPAPSCDQPCAY